MNDVPGQVAESVAQQRLLRDLTSLLALPAFWSGTDPALVLRTFFEALESLLGLDVCYGSTTIDGTVRLDVLRIGRMPVLPADPAGAAVIAVADAGTPGERRDTIDLSGTAVHCLCLPIGYAGEVGRIVVGSSRPGFPDATELVLVRAGLSLAASGLETARVIHQRDEAQRAKDEFLAMLGHELRNPLAPIVTAVQLMALKAGAAKTREQQIIERQVQHLRRLVDDLLDVSRIARGKIELRSERIDLADVVARAIEAVMPAVEAAGHAVEVEVPQGLVVDGDPLRLTQVLLNLLTNAAKYTPGGGRIAVFATASGAIVTVRVIDNGTGLAPDLLPHVFDLFVQGRRSLGRSEGGLGIGLALVKQLVQAHGGTVAAFSDGPGTGSEFLVTLPLAAGPVATARAVDPDDELDSVAAGSGINVLVVDDNSDAADSGGHRAHRCRPPGRSRLQRAGGARARCRLAPRRRRARHRPARHGRLPDRRRAAAAASRSRLPDDCADRLRPAARPDAERRRGVCRAPGQAGGSGAADCRRRPPGRR